MPTLCLALVLAAAPLLGSEQPGAPAGPNSSSAAPYYHSPRMDSLADFATKIIQI